MPGFRWRLGDYVGGDKAVHQAYKPWLALALNRTPVKEWSVGEILIQPGDTSSLAVTGLGFEPDVVLLVGYRPRYANGGSDAAFGARGGGYTFGVAGKGLTSLVQFTGSSRIRHAFEPNISYWREDSCFSVAHDFGATDILRLTCDLDTDGFTLHQNINLYDESAYVAWIALKGRFLTGIMTTGDVDTYGVPGRPQGGLFLSTKHTSGQTFRDGHWNHMQGFGVRNGSQACIWGGCQPTEWNWTTERWEDDRALVLCTAASGSSFVGASYDVGGLISNWWEDESTVTITRSGSTATVSHASHGFASGMRILIEGADQQQYNGVHEITVTGGSSYEYTVVGTPNTPATGSILAIVGTIDWQWSPFGNQGYRVGYVLTGDPADHGVLETNWETRPGGSQNDFPDGSNYIPTAVRPDVVFMAATNYTFSYSNLDPFDSPRLPGVFQFGGSGGFGWHASPYILSGTGDAWGVHTFGNAVAERGRYANSGTQYLRNYIMAGQGANSSPPAYHQHSVNIVPNPVIVGLNYRYAERHGQVKRIHINRSDVYIP